GVKSSVDRSTLGSSCRQLTSPRLRLDCATPLITGALWAVGPIVNSRSSPGRYCWYPGSSINHIFSVPITRVPLSRWMWPDRDSEADITTATSSADHPLLRMYTYSPG